MTAPGARAARRALARHADEETRYQAVARLDPADGEDRAVLVERLGDPSWRVRSAAAERLGALPGGAAALPELLEALASGPGVGPREAAAAALARLGPPAVPRLLERLGAADADLRQAVAGVLGAIEDARAAAPLAARLADPDPNVRVAAADALGRIGGPQALDALRAALESDEGDLRASAAEALVRQRASLAAPVLERLGADRALRRSAHRLLGASDDPDALPLLARALADPSHSAREAALAALSQQRARRGEAALAPLLEDVGRAARADPGLTDAWAAALGAEDREVCAGALVALGAAGAPRHVPALLRAIDDDRLRPLAEDALDALPPGPELRAALADALPGLGQEARVVALGALARLGSAASLESLVREASDPGSRVQAEAVASLGRLSDARGVLPLAGLLGDDAPAVAGLAATALVRLGEAGPEPRRAVLAALRARVEASPSAAALRTLGALGDAADLGALCAALRAGAAAHRSAAAAAVATLARRGHGAGAAVSALVAAVSDPAWSVRAAAARALADCARAGGHAPGGDAIAALRRARSDVEPGVRAAAIDALGACAGADGTGAIAAAAGVRWGAGEAPRMSEAEFRLLRDLVHAHCGLAFADGMRFLLERRLAARLEALDLSSFGEYHRFLRHDPGRAAELDEAVDLLTTNETYFYREPLQLEAFRREILPACAEALGAARRLRVISAGCATGEEAYTLAILVRDSRLFEGWDVEVVGTDISRRCIAVAQAGAYGEHAFRYPEAAPMRRWFRLRGGKWVVDDAVKGMVRFTRENLLGPDALGARASADVLFCRNVMMYFDVPDRRRMLRRFHEVLREGGWLLLGHAESLLNVTADFELVHLASDLVYRKPSRAAAAGGEP